MANFGAMVLTKQGLQLQAQAQTGGTLTFTSVIAGAGYLADGQDPVTLTELISPVSTATLNITSNEIVGDGTTNLKARIQSGSKAFYLREIGVMAKINNGTPVLYAYANAGDYADFIPSVGSSTEVVQDLNLITIIGNTENVTANITLDVIPDGSITHNKIDDVLAKLIWGPIIPITVTSYDYTMGSPYILHLNIGAAISSLVNGVRISFTPLVDQYETQTKTSMRESEGGVKSLDIIKASNNEDIASTEWDTAKTYVGVVQDSKIYVVDL